MSKKNKRDKSRPPIQLIETGCGMLLIGIALSTLGAPEVGSWVSVLGAGAAIWGVHRFGRLGPDPALVFAREPKKNRKSRRRSSSEAQKHE